MAQQRIEVKPLTPAEVHTKFINELDPNMIQAVNNLLVRNYSPNSNGTIHFLQKDLLDEYFKLVPIPSGKSRSAMEQDLFNRNQLDFEDIFKKQGWSITYDKPAYNETYEPSFDFKPKKK